MRKTRKELRKEIAESVSRLESDIFLGMLLQISEMFRKSFDDEECEELSDLQWNQRAVIRDVLSIDDAEAVGSVASLIAGMRGQTLKTDEWI